MGVHLPVKGEGHNHQVALYVRENLLKLREGDRLFPDTKLVTCVLALLVKVVLWIITRSLFTGSEMQPNRTMVRKCDFH